MPVVDLWTCDNALRMNQRYECLNGIPRGEYAAESHDYEPVLDCACRIFSASRTALCNRLFRLLWSRVFTECHTFVERYTLISASKILCLTLTVWFIQRLIMLKAKCPGSKSMKRCPSKKSCTKVLASSMLRSSIRRVASLHRS